MPSKFDKENINAINETYQRQYREKVELAANDYLDWMKKNARGTRLITRFSHFFHGDSGKQRVTNLLKILRDPPAGDFSYVVHHVGHAMRDSGYKEHSFNRYIYRSLTDKQAMANGPRKKDYEFYQQIKTELKDELSQDKSTLSDYSFLALTKGVSNVYEAYVGRLELESNLANAKARAMVNSTIIVHDSSYGYQSNSHHHHGHHPHS